MAAAKSPTEFAQEEIKKTIQEIDTIIKNINLLMVDLGEFHDFILKKDVSGSGIILEMIAILGDAKKLFDEQKKLYEELSGQIELKEPFTIGPSEGVAEAEKTLDYIRIKENEIRAKKSALRQKGIVLNHIISMLQSRETMDETIKRIQAELESLTEPKRESE